MPLISVNTFVVDPFSGPYSQNPGQRQFISTVGLSPTSMPIGTVTPADGGPPSLGTINGICTESGSPVGGCVVRLYYKPTGELIRTTTSAVDGTYSFPVLNHNINDYYAIATLDGGLQVYNFIAQSELQPLVNNLPPTMAVFSPQKLVHPNPTGITNFGECVIFSGDGTRLFVCSILNATTSSVVVYQLSSGTWTYHSTITPGYRIDVYGPTTVAPGNGDTFFFQDYDSGSIVKFSWSGSAWSQVFVTTTTGSIAAMSANSLMVANVNTSPDQILISEYNGAAQEWDILQSTLVAPGAGSFFGQICAFSPDGTTFAALDLVKSPQSPSGDHLRLSVYVRQLNGAYLSNTLRTLSLPSFFINSPSFLSRQHIKIHMSTSGDVIAIGSSRETFNTPDYVVFDGLSWTSYEQGFLYVATYDSPSGTWRVASPFTAPDYSTDFTPLVSGSFIYAPQFGGGVGVSPDGTKIIAGETGWRTNGQMIASETLAIPRNYKWGRVVGYQLQSGVYNRTLDYTPPDATVVSEYGSVIASTDTYMATGLPSENAAYVSKYDG